MKRQICILFLSFLGNLIYAQEAKQEHLSDYLKDNWKTPEEYVIDKFQEHDYIFVGEMHRVKHDVEFISNLIPVLYKNKVYCLGIEFGYYPDQALVDSMLTAAEFDRKLARSFVFDFYPVWAYKEYIDIYQKAWEVNNNNGPDNHVFRIVNLGCKINPCISDCNRDRFMANVIFKEIASKGQKALIYTGIHHAFTKYNQPYYDFEKDTLHGFNSKRMGNILYDSLGNKTLTIYLHAAWTSNKGWDKPMVKPADGMIDEVMENFTDKRVGFDVFDSPFGQLKSGNTYYAFGYPDFNLSNFCDGYIYQNSFKDYEPITMEENFITAENINELKDYYRCIKLPDRYIRSVTVKNADKKLKEDVRRLIRHLK